MNEYIVKLKVYGNLDPDKLDNCYIDKIIYTTNEDVEIINNKKYNINDMNIKQLFDNTNNNIFKALAILLANEYSILNNNLLKKDNYNYIYDDNDNKELIKQIKSYFRNSKKFRTNDDISNHLRSSIEGYIHDSMACPLEEKPFPMQIYERYEIDNNNEHKFYELIFSSNKQCINFFRRFIDKYNEYEDRGSDIKQINNIISSKMLNNSITNRILYLTAFIEGFGRNGNYDRFYKLRNKINELEDKN